MEFKRDNNVNIYNLSSGKSLPDWISERKRRMLQKKDVDIRRRIELIQDFEMPGVSTGVKMSRDGNFIFATGVYKPRIRCYDVNNLSMKFERCFDAEAVQFELLSDDYTKFALLQCDRTVELHVQYGSYYKTRIPKFGRDILYHKESCDLLVAGASPDIYRLNLAQGRYLSPYHTNASSVNKLAIHEECDIIACGTMEGKIEAWDPRMRERINTLDCAFSCMTDSTTVNGFHSITALSFQGGKIMGVGTFTGQLMLYDIRSNKPFLVQNHGAGHPIKNVAFIENMELVASLDPKCVKLWRQNTGALYTSIYSDSHLNDLCVVPNSGLLFLANEDKKIKSYFIPSIGPAPKWCCFLDSITEELAEDKQENVYDDYKFVTKDELEQLRLDYLFGTEALRAYMHGFFMDIRLYNKARSLLQLDAPKESRKIVLRTLEKERNTNQIQLKSREMLYPVMDKRFRAVNENPDFKIEETAEEYSRIKAIVERGNNKKSKKRLSPVESEQVESFNEQDRGSQSSSYSDSESESSADEELQAQKAKKKRIFQSVDSDQFSMNRKNTEEEDASLPIEERLKKINSSFKATTSAAGDKVVTWSTQKPGKLNKRDEEKKAHIKERAKFRRPAKYVRK